ncbi:hypothetical protein PT974_09765 [Cladobotryum mycophilum]|uniref:Uncharacterized protein n=1 Tax=Cladobotryum mycophilum TaxID=491253 RepID=A0ABR0SH41_9HYPO
MIQHTPNCTLPESTPSGFINAPKIRTTMQIVWSCLSVILLCTWSILHLNVPPHMTPDGSRQSMRKKLYLLLRKVYWMVVMLVAPEFLTIFTTKKMQGTRENHKELERLADHDDIPWTLLHTILADMGGFAIRFPSNKEEAGDQSEQGNFIRRTPSTEQLTAEPRSPESLESQIPEDDIRQVPDFVEVFRKRQKLWVGDCKIPWKPYEGHFKHAKKLKERLPKDTLDWETQNIAALSGTVWILDSRQLCIARERKVIKSLPKIAEDEITDRNKSDDLVKFLAILQVLWLVVQLIARRFHNLPFAQLEISTVAFSVSAFILYMLEWEKPKDINVPIYLDAYEPSVSYETFEEIAKAAPFPYVQFPGLQSKNYHIPNCAFHETKRSDPKNVGPNKTELEKASLDKAMLKKFDIHAFLVAFVTVASFGGIHFFAWNLQFPTKIEQLLWRISAIVAVAMPCIYSASHAPFMGTIPKGIPKSKAMKVQATVLLTSFFYVFARLYLITESVRSLYYLPHDAFISNWASNVPHMA